jgi:hypothetical protein
MSDKDHRFLVGEAFENRRGSFKVVAISGDNMRILFASGEHVDTTTTAQERIITNIEREQQIEANLAQVKVKKKR